MGLRRSPRCSGAGSDSAIASAAHGGGLLSLVGPFCGFLLAMVLLYSRAAVPFLYFQF